MRKHITSALRQIINDILKTGVVEIITDDLVYEVESKLQIDTTTARVTARLREMRATGEIEYAIRRDGNQSFYQFSKPKRVGINISKHIASSVIRLGVRNGEPKSG